MQKRLKKRLDMKSKQVLSIDQMKHLRELGLDMSDVCAGVALFLIKMQNGNLKYMKM